MTRPRLLATMLIAAPLLARAEAVPPDAAQRFFDEAKRLSDADGGRLWGQPLYGPMFFVDPISRELVANQQDPQRQLKPLGDVFTGTLPDQCGPANTAAAFAGLTWTMLQWPLPEAKYTRGRLMTHELFHRIQADIGLPAANPANNHLDTREGRVWLQLEWRALSEALIHTGEERRRAAADALAFRRHRRSLFPGAGESERGLEMNEGLAEYTGYRLCGLPEAVLPDRVAIRLDQQQGGTGFVRNFAYVSGPAYGLLLDAAQPDWRKGLTPQNDLGDLVAGGLALGDLPTDEADLMRAADRYDGRTLIAAEKQREEHRQQQLAGYKKRFFDGPVLILAASTEVSYSYDPNGVTAYDDVASVYDPFRATDAWGILDVPNGGAIVIRKDGRVAEIRVPAPAGLDARPLSGDGWTLRPNEGWTLVPGARRGDFTLGPAPAGHK